MIKAQTPFYHQRKVVLGQNNHSLNSKFNHTLSILQNPILISLILTSLRQPTPLLDRLPSKSPRNKINSTPSWKKLSRYPKNPRDSDVKFMISRAKITGLVFKTGLLRREHKRKANVLSSVRN